MSANLLALIAIIPGVSIAGLMWYLDKEREDPRTLLGMFFLGGVMVVPPLLMQNQSVDWGLGDTSSLGFAIFFAFIIIAFTEEIVKYLALRFAIIPQKYVDEPMDGIVYSVMLGMGFATIENIFYTISLGIEFGLFRMFTAVPAHAAFSVIMGYYLGQAKFDKINRKILLTKAFAVPFVLHGFYDFFVVQESYEILSIGIFVVLIGALVLAGFLIKKVKEEKAEEVELTENPEGNLMVAEENTVSEEVVSSAAITNDEVVELASSEEPPLVPEEALVQEKEEEVIPEPTEIVDKGVEAKEDGLNEMQEDLNSIMEDLDQMKEDMDETK